MKPRQAVPFALAALALLSCSTPAPTPFFADGSLGPAAPDLQRLAKSGFSVGWLRPDVSFASYDAVHLVYPEVTYRTPPRSSSRRAFGRDNYPLSVGFTRDLMSALEQSFRDEMAAATGWRPTADAKADQGQGTLEIQVALVDLEVHVPLERLANDALAWVVSIGAVTVVIDLYDAPTHRMLARFAERRFIATASWRPIKATPGPSLYEARRIFLAWARSLRRVVETLESTAVPTASLTTPAPAI